VFADIVYDRCSHYVTCELLAVVLVPPQIVNTKVTNAHTITSVPMFRLSTVGSWTFNVSGPWIWNGLPEDVSDADLNPSSSSSHILILSSNCTFDTIVVLLVMFIT